MSSDSFLWHDYETFGTDPRRDRPCQFAALRTGADLVPAGEPVVLYCQPTDDVLPVPEACLITGISPQAASERGLPEYRFAREIFDLMTRPGTCSAGYNNFRFDDEITRFLLWRNFLDPYVREYANGNSRFDLIDVLRMTRALRPGGIEWVSREDGHPGFRLEDLAAANGLDTSRAHDALADVENTVAMARLVAQAQPRLWSWALGLRARHVVAGLLEKREPLIHTSARFPAAEMCTAPVLPLFPHPRIRSQWLVWNLRHDPEPFTFMDLDELSDRYWTAAADLPDEAERLPVKWVRTNRCPMLSPMGVLDAASRRRLDIDHERVARHAGLLHRRSAFLHTLTELFSQPDPDRELDAEQDLYRGFMPDGDRRLASTVPEADELDLKNLGSPFRDERLNTLLFRYRARHFPGSLSEAERRAWTEYRRRRLVDDPELASIRLDEYRLRVAALMQQKPGYRSLLEHLAAWPAEIGAAEWTADGRSNS